MERSGQDILVLFDGSRKLRSLPGSIQILREGPQVGVYAVCLDADERLLPAGCHAVTIVEPGGLLRVQQMMAATIRNVRPDHVSPGWCARPARGMAPVRDVSDDDDAAGLPDSARLLDVLRLEPPTAEAIAARWNAGGRSTLAMVGESYDGPFGIDMRKDGPHGLVAGTTGAGKSELLQTIVASLATANRPDEMTFVLVDYKGGSAFKDCVQLPHTANIRAQESLDSPGGKTGGHGIQILRSAFTSSHPCLLIRLSYSSTTRSLRLFLHIVGPSRPGLGGPGPAER